MIEMIVARPSRLLRMISGSLAFRAPASSTLIVSGPRLATNVATVAAESSLPRTTFNQTITKPMATTSTATPIIL
jgi:hypothetical protein